MRVPISWLEEFLPLGDIEAERIAEVLSLRSVEACVSVFGIKLEGVVVGEILEVRRKRDFWVVEVSVGKGARVSVVTKDGTLSEGERVVVALPGARVGEREITKGVLLSAQELGLEDAEEGVLRVDEPCEIGADVSPLLGFGEKVIELDVTPNRGDVLSVRGLARELSALLDLSRKDTEKPSFQECGDIEVKVEGEGCWRYRGAVLEGVKVSASPLKVRRRLWQCGIKSINNVVDITNYILLQEGQPLHAFDLDKIEGGVRVRDSVEGERIKTLDGNDVELGEGVLVIADEKGPIAIAGIVGGYRSAVGRDTDKILLEAAYFEPSKVRKGTKRTGIYTESSYRFERNVDIERLSFAQDTAISMLIEITGARLVALRDLRVKKYEPRKVFLSWGKYERYTGERLREEEVRKVLGALEIPHRIKECGVEVFVPPHRSFDMHGDADVIEELLRVKGYDTVKPEPPRLPAKGQLRKDGTWEVRRFLRDKGLEEVITLPYEDCELYELLHMEKPSLEILNPLVPSQRYMRSSLIPSLLKVALFNMSHYNHDVGIFEIGKVFSEKGEEERIGLLLNGKLRDFPHVKWDHYDLLEIVQGIASLFGKEILFDVSDLPFLHTGAQAEVLLGGERIGFVGMLHPAFAEKLELVGNVLLGEIKREKLTSPAIPEYSPVSKFPPVVRDLSLLVDKKLSVSKLLNEIKSQLCGMVEEVVLFDLYAGEKVGEGKKSVGVRLIFRSLEGSLPGEEVNSSLEDVVRRLKEKFGAEIR